MVARGGIEPPTRGFSVPLVWAFCVTHRCLSAPCSRQLAAIDDAGATVGDGGLGTKVGTGYRRRPRQRLAGVNGGADTTSMYPRGVTAIMHLRTVGCLYGAVLRSSHHTALHPYRVGDTLPHNREGTTGSRMTEGPATEIQANAGADALIRYTLHDRAVADGGQISPDRTSRALQTMSTSETLAVPITP